MTLFYVLVTILLLLAGITAILYVFIPWLMDRDSVFEDRKVRYVFNNETGEIERIL